jgi:excinuclease ABC subunit C
VRGGCGARPIGYAGRMSELGALRVDELLSAIAAKTPTPGGGAVAGVVGATGCALASMVVAYSIGKKSLAEHQSALESARGRLERARELFLSLGDEDAQAYALLNELQRLAPDSARRDELPAALRVCVRVPMAMLAASADVAGLLATLGPITNTHLRSDLDIARELVRATARSSVLNVEVNLASLSALGPEGEVESTRAREQARAMLERALAERAYSASVLPEADNEAGVSREGGSVGPESRDERLARLLRAARALPDVPGVYLMKDSAGDVVYVGKAVRLPDRVSSYFVPSADLGAKKQPMLDVVAAFDVIECETEWEALLTENRLIKDLRPSPRFNVRLKDGKSFPYLVVTRNEDYPRVKVTRNPSDPALLSGARVFGPFTNVGALREGVQILQRVFKFRTCDLEIVAGDARNRGFRPCLLHAIDQCTAPCAERIGVEAYGSDVERFVRFMGSKRSAMLRELRAEMESASRALAFERAAQLRDQVRALEGLDERARRSASRAGASAGGGASGGGESVGDGGWQPEAEIAYRDPLKACQGLAKLLEMDRAVRCVEGIDIAHLQGREVVGSKVCFVDGRPFKEGYRRYRLESARNDDFMAIREVVSRRYREAGAGHELYPDVIMIDGGVGQLNAAVEALAGLEVQPPMVVSLAKKEEIVFVRGREGGLRVSRTNAGLRLLQQVRDEAHRFAQAYHHALRRGSVLGEKLEPPQKRRRKAAPKAPEGTSTDGDARE